MGHFLIGAFIGSLVTFTVMCLTYYGAGGRGGEDEHKT